MKIIIALAVTACLVIPAAAQYGSSYGNSYGSNSGLYGTGSNPNNHPSSGYTIQSGTYVAPHYQTNPNNTQLDNYGTRGNVNPYTGAVGTRSPRW